MAAPRRKYYVSKADHTTDIRALCRVWTPKVVAQLGRIATRGDSDSARVAACVALLDRGWGKPHQAHTVEGDSDIRVTIRHIVQGLTPPPPETVVHLLDDKTDD